MATCATAKSERPARHALIVGNSAYQSVTNLDNPRNDAVDIAKYLKVLGFQNTILLDRTHQDSKRAFQKFLDKLKPGDIALFYYSGHAIQLNGANYLLTPNFRLETKAENTQPQLINLINLNKFIQKLESRTGTNLIFLDACRNDPFIKQKQLLHSSAQNQQVTRAMSQLKASIKPGLASISSTSGDTLIIYAALSGKTALDGTGHRNSPFTETLLQHINKPDIEIEVMLKQVTRGVKRLTNGKQTPERLSRLTSEFYFNRKKITLALLPKIPSPYEARQQKKKTGAVFRDCAYCPEMVVLPSGSFSMGSAQNEKGHSKTEGPVHLARVSYRMAVSKYEITFAQWDACVQNGGCQHYKPEDHGWGRHNYPVMNVSWHDVQHYINWIKQETGKNYRLLSETEWEYAARAGSTTAYITGRSLPATKANIDGSTQFIRGHPGLYRGKTSAVGQFSPNAFGLYDMSGNLFEWVQDCWHNSYHTIPSDGSASKGSANCKARVVRGGSWYFEDKMARSAARKHFPSTSRRNITGFRLVYRLP